MSPQAQPSVSEGATPAPRGRLFRKYLVSFAAVASSALIDSV